MKTIGIVVSIGAILAACGEGGTTATALSSSPAKMSASAPIASSPTPTASAPASAAAPPASASAEFTPGPEIKVGAMKLVIQDEKETMTIEVTPDGTVKPSNPKAEDKPIRFVKNELQDETGKWIIRLGADGTLEVRQVHRKLENGKVVSEKEEIKKMGTLKDNVLTANDGTFTVTEKGEVQTTKTGGQTETMKEFKVEGVTPETRTAAILLVFGMFVAGTTESGTTSSTPPAVSAKPPPPATPKGL
jgi:hypothetical protein